MSPSARNTRSDALPAHLRNHLAALAQAGRYAELEARARALLGTHSRCGFTWKVLGIALRSQGMDARDALLRASKLAPRDAEAHSNLSDARLAAREFDAAARSCRRALELNPRLAPAHLNLGHAMRGLGQLDEAIASYRRAVQLDPQFVQAHMGLGNALLACDAAAAAAASYRRVIELVPGYAEAHSNLGHALRLERRWADAAASCRRALELKPDLAEAHNNLGNALCALVQLDAAIASYRHALKLDPEYAEAHSNLAGALLQAGWLADAEQSARCALACRPGYAEAHQHLGAALLAQGDLEAAAASFRQALHGNARYADAHQGLGATLRAMGRPVEAECSASQALELEPTLAAGLALLAELEADRGQFAAAEALLRRAAEHEPTLPAPWAGIPHLRQMGAADTAWLEVAQDFCARPLAPRQEAHLRFALGKYFDDLGEYATAFAHYRRANEATRAIRPPHDRARLSHSVDELIQVFSAPRRMQLPEPISRAVLIVGMPRSGTTLAEQILASHAAVFGAGELPFWTQAMNGLNTLAPTRDALEASARDYLRELESRSAGSARVVDKMPANFFNVGLIHAALPGARVIHLRRDPIDTCLSIYRQDFSAAHTYAHDLADLAHYYREYARLMGHWHATLPPSALLDVPYEALVADPATWTRHMLEFIELPWDPGCLEFHRAERPVITASRWQVRQTLNRGSIGRWRHYERDIGPLLGLATLEPATGAPGGRA